ncbi:MAG: cytochrome b/b6 domain-containing protein [Betaproteobacteria bacterium]
MEKTRILVWDLPVRVFHWLLALSFAGAFLTADSERVRDIHVTLGYTFVGLLVFRLVWGVIGSRYARFTSFAFHPSAVLAYLRSLLTRHPKHYVGHNPAGSWAIFAIITLGVGTGASGYAVYNDVGGHWIGSLHEGAANALLALVIFHIAGVVVSSILHRENLAAAMVTGYKTGRPSDAIGRTRWMTAVALIAAVGVLWSGVFEVPGLFPGTANATTSKADGRSHHSRDHARGHDN